MSAKKYLSQARWLDRMIDNKVEQQERLRALAEKTTGDVSTERVSGSTRTDSRENVMVKLIDLSHEINADIDGLIDLQKEIMDTISQLEESKLILILEMRYVNGKSWDDVSQALHCDKRWVMRLHRKALTEIDEILKNSPPKDTQSPQTPPAKCDIV